ncbi:MAG: cadherin-like beta sandwich domain-containing protein [Bacteroidales bacterium]|nr:cadherin-like beta sandwich domain-containing protein [Bacteroidales bacterium]
MSYQFRFFSILVASLFVHILYAQISFGGIPLSWQKGNSILKSSKELKSHQINNPFTIQQLIDDEELYDGMPERVGINLMAGLSLTEDGEWETLRSGENLCRLKIESKGALAISLYYSSFRIPKDGKLFIYSGDNSHLLGAYTHETNPEGGIFASEFVAGDNLILEYFSPSLHEKPEIKIEKICYGYKNLKVSTSSETSCMIDVECEEGEAWRDEKDGVVKMVTTIGAYSYLCTASLLNNTAQDFTPYIYTAFHCLESSSQTVTEEELKQSLFYFNYESTECGSEEVKPTVTLTGCSLLAGSSLYSSEGLDQALLLLDSNLPSDFLPYFNGWDIASKPAQSGVCIHHPKGVVKKISTFISPATSDTWTKPEGGINAHWLVSFSRTLNGHSATEKGSSGSPLFNQEKNIVGSLTGGSSSCTTPSGSNYYGKIERFWTHISKYLDPFNSGVTKMSGRRKDDTKPAPKGLTIKAENNSSDVYLSWQPVKETPLNYVVYRNGVIVERPIVPEFKEHNLYVGKHIYQVSAYYNDGVSSSKSEQAVAIKHPTSTPQIDTIKRKGENEVDIEWKLPKTMQKVFWGSGKAANKVSFKNLSSPIYFGQRWYREDIAEVNGYAIEQVEFYRLANTSYTLYIKQGNRIFTQDIDTSSKDELVILKLETPYIISSNEPLICALRVNKAESYMVAIDDASAVEGKGNVISEDGYSWDTFGNNNFYLKLYMTNGIEREEYVENSEQESAIVASSIPVPFVTPKKYNIYRDDNLLSTVSSGEYKYSDENLQKGEKYLYSVEADYGDCGLYKSDRYEFNLSDKSYNAQIESLTINGVIISPDEDIYNYSADCSNENVQIVVTPKDNATILIDGEERTNYEKDISVGGKFDIPITVISESGENTSVSELYIYKLPQNIIIKRWDDVITVVNNPAVNGGLEFMQYVWYKNGEKLPYLSQYITTNDALNGDDYVVELQTAEGIWLKSCSYIYETDIEKIHLYPQLVERGGDINLNINISDGREVLAYISDMMGQTSPLQVNVGDNILKAPNVSGTYIINVVISGGETKTIKIMVK